MRPHQIEAWALAVIEQVGAGCRTEDSRVELKSEFPPPQRTARRLAGHANAARGAPILWLVGVDENHGVTGADQQDLASWWPSVKAEFDGLAPVLMDLVVPTDAGPIVALYFETDRAPFTVRNPRYGAPEGGPVQREVPWREGTSVRSATRADLIGLLSPLQSIPSFEVLKCWLSIKETGSGDDPSWHWYLAIWLYAGTVLETPAVVPFHRCSAQITVGREGRTQELPSILMASPGNSLSIETTHQEAIISGPGRIDLSAGFNAEPWCSLTGDALVDVHLRPVGATQDVHISTVIPQHPPRTEELHRWALIESQ